MEQNDSLQSSLKELIAIEKEQARLLIEMNSRDSVVETQKLMDSTTESSRASSTSSAYDPGVVQNGTANMYAYASKYGNQAGVATYSPPPMMYSEQNGQIRQQQFSEYASGVGSDETSYGFVSSLAPRNSRTSNESRTVMAMDVGSRVAQAGMAGTAALGSAGATFALGGAMGGSVAGFLGSMALTGGVAAGIGLYADASLDEMKKQSAYRKYLTQNSYMFINPGESNNNRDIAGFNQKETKEASNFLRGLSNKNFLKDEEIMKLTQKFTEGGLLKDTKDLESFKKQMEALTKGVKTGALILNETYDNIASVMAEMKKLGIDQKDYNKVMSGFKVNASNLGMDASQYTQQVLDFVANLNYGTGNSSTNTITRLEDNTVYMNGLYEQLSETPNYKRTEQEKSAYNMIKNLGGVDKAAQHVLTMQEKILDQDTLAKNVAGYFFDFDSQKKDWNLNLAKFDDFLSSDKTIEDIFGDVTKKFQQLHDDGYGAEVNAFQTNAGTYMRNNMTEGDVSKFLQGTMNAYLRDPNMAANGYDTTKILSDVFGVTDSGNQNLLGQYLNFRVGSGDGLGHQYNQQKQWTEVINETKAQTPSIGEAAGAMWDKTKKFFTQIPVNFGDAMSDLGVGISDWWYKQRNGVAPARLNEDFSIKALTHGSSAEGVAVAQRNALGVIGDTSDALKSLSEKGYSINSELLNITENALDSFNSTVERSREKIANWGQVDDGVSGYRNMIEEVSKNTDLSEVILAALVKYGQQNGSEEITKEDLNNVAEKLSTTLDKYQGNETLGMLSLANPNMDIDGMLKEKFSIDVNNLTEEMKQAMKDIKIDDIEMSEETKKLVKELLNVDISRGGANYTPGETSGTSHDEVKNKDIRIKSNVNASDIDKIIEANSSEGSHMRGMGEAIIKASQESGLDAMYIMSHAALETGWGSSSILNDKNNWFGIGAFDSSPYESAYNFNSLEAGLVEGAKWISENYTNSERHEQDSLYKMINDKEGWHNYATDPEWADKIAGIITSGLEKVGKGYDGDEGSTTSNHGVSTIEETYIDNTNLSKEEQERRNTLDKGFQISSEARSQKDFLKEVVNMSELIDTDNIYDASKDIVNKTYGGANDYNKHIQKQLDKGLSWDEIQNQDKTKSLREGALFKSKVHAKDGTIEELMNDLDSMYAANDRYNGENGQSNKKQYVLEQFGKSLGISSSDYGGDIVKYDAALNDFATNQVKNTMSDMEAYLDWKKNGGEKTAQINKVENMSVVDKMAALESADLLNGVLGGDTTGYEDIYEEIDVAINGTGAKVSAMDKKEIMDDKKNRLNELNSMKSSDYMSMSQNEIEALARERNELQRDISRGEEGIEEDARKYAIESALMSDKDKELKEYLHKDSKGNIYYDPNNKSTDEIHAADINAWYDGGEKKVDSNWSKIKFQTDKGVITSSMTFDEAMDEAKKTYDTVRTEASENSTKVRTIMSGLEDSSLYGEMNSYVLNNDAEGLKKFVADIKAGTAVDKDGNAIDRSAISGDEGEINQLIMSLDKLKDAAKIDELMDLVSALQTMKDSLADVATAARMTMSDLDEGQKMNTTENISQDVLQMFTTLSEQNKGTDEGKDLDKVLKGLEKMDSASITEAIMQALESGEGIKVKGESKPIELSADTLQELGATVSKNMDDAIKQSLKSDTNYGDGEGFEKLISGNEKSIASVLGLDVDGLQEKLDELAKLNSDLASRTDTQTEDYKKLESDRDRNVEEIFKAYSESMKGYEESGKTATETFSTAIEKYDASVAKAISTLESRIDKGFLGMNGLMYNIEQGVKNIFSKPDKSDNGGSVRE